MKPSVGLVIPQGWRLDLPKHQPDEQYALMECVLLKAEELGLHSAWLYDHFHTYPAVRREPVFEPWITLTAFAKATTRIRLGILVSCNSYRHPTLLAKMSSVFDVVSGGRMEFGIGAGWYEQEYRAFGYDFMTNAGRIRMLEEAAQIIKRMWTEDEVTFNGRFYNVVGALNYPKPLQKPRPRMLIGGAGEKLTLKVVARHADRWNTGGDPATYRRKMETLHSYLDMMGRKTHEVECTYHATIILEETDEKAQRRLKRLGEAWGIQPDELARRNPVGGPEKVVDFLTKIRDTGVGYFMLYVFDAVNEGKLEFFCDEVLPNL